MTRYLKQRVKTAKFRSNSSTKWLQRQLNDPYVKMAKDMNYRSRAAFKLLEIDERYNILKKGQRVVDLGAAPGGWSQVAADKVGSTPENIRVFGLDLLEIKPIDNAKLLQMDFLDDNAPNALKEIMGGPADVVMSDMAANTTGMPDIDHQRIMILLELAFEFAKEVLNKDGVFIGKVFQGGTENTLLAEMKKAFKKVIHVKPKASRQDSSEFYVLATGFKGL